MRKIKKHQGKYEFFKHFSVELTQATGFNDLVYIFLRQAVDTCHLKAFSIFEWNPQKKGSFEDVVIERFVELPLKTLPSSNRAIKLELEKNVPQLHEFEYGINVLQVEEKEYYVFQLSDCDHNVKIALCEIDGEHTSDLRKLDMLVYFLQNQAKWWNRLMLAEEKLNRDDLTDSYSHRYLDYVLDKEIKRASRFEEEFSVLFIDLDNFKSVNDIYGHLSGSSVLKQVALVFKELLREVDCVIRYGGDEFVILLLGADCFSAANVAERIRYTVAHKAFQTVNEQTVSISTSIGIASYPRHGKDKETLLKVADLAMYQSKNSGKNKVHIYAEQAGLVNQFS